MPPTSDKALDNVHGEHDDGLWPDFDLSTQSVRTQEAVDTGYTHDTVVKQPEAKKKADSDKS